LKLWRFARNTLSETKINIYTPKRDDEHPRLVYMGVPPPRGPNHLSSSTITFTLIEYEEDCFGQPDYSTKISIHSTLYRFLLTKKKCFAHSPLTFTSLLIYSRRQRLSECWTAHTTVTERLVALVAVE